MQRGAIWTLTAGIKLSFFSLSFQIVFMIPFLHLMSLSVEFSTLKNLSVRSSECVQGVLMEDESNEMEPGQGELGHPT